MLFNLFDVSYKIKNGFDIRAVIPIVIATVFCFSFIQMHPFKVPASPTYNSTSTQQAPITVLNPQSLPIISSITMNDDPFNVEGSIQTLQLQQQPTNMGLNSGSTNSNTPSIDPTSLDNLNIKVPRTSNYHFSRLQTAKHSDLEDNKNDGSSDSAGSDLQNSYSPPSDTSQQY
jgi:hypothetical protein